MALVNAYIDDIHTAAEVLGFRSDLGGEKELLVESAATAASRDVDAFCGRRFYVDDTATARKYVADHRWELEVDDISTISGLIVATDHDYDGTFETTWTIDTHFQVEPVNREVDGIGSWPIERLRAVDVLYWPRYRGRALVQVTAKWGWSSVPEPVKQATLNQLATIYKSPDAPFGVANIDQFGPIRARALHPTAAHLLHPYRRSTMGGP